jgi:SAM-dependent methyltransferase
VIGIDQDPGFVAKARERVPEATFLERSWQDLPAEKFDVILMLSALHYEDRPREFLHRLHDHLTDDGLLILEVGVASERGMTRVWTQRNSTVFHPTWDMLASRYLEPFAFRVLGRSVDQAGDPVPRWVVHCQRLKPTVLLISGNAEMGKSSLARGLGRGQVVTVEIDSMLRRVLASMERADRPILELLETYRGVVPKSYRNIVLGIEGAGLSAEFADLIVAHIPLDEEVVIVEGYGLRGETLARLQERLETVAYVWSANRLDLSSDDGAKEAELEALRLQVSQLRRTGDDLRRSAAATKLEFEALAEDRERLIGERDIATEKLARLRKRRSVKTALWAAELVKPIMGGSKKTVGDGESRRDGRILS